MNKRDLVKWQPFDAVIPGRLMVKDVLSKERKIVMPTLSDDQLNVIQENILQAYERQNVISIDYYKGGNIYQKIGIITNIDVIKRKITINMNFVIYFEQIIKVF